MSIAVTTDAVAVKERFDFWHEVICNAFVRLEAETLPSEQPFRAEIARSDLGPLTLSRVRAQPHAVQRSTQLISAEPRDEVLVSVQLCGNAVIQQDDRQAVLDPGDFAMYDATRPYDLIMREQFEMLVFQFDRQFLMERCPSPERLTAVRMSNDTTVTAPVSAFLRSLEPLALGDDNAVSRQLATSALDLLGVALADRFGTDGSPNAGRTKHFLRACTYMNAYASDPDLTPARIASSIGVSLRYLHAIFKENGMTVNEYLIKRRLARCMDDLLGPIGAKRTITEIAHSNGFKTSAHFSRRFTEAYGRSPREVKQAGSTRGQ
ncbi:MAG: helix-turn-helix domain-containing protein [Acidimicrobiaceae bacterium]|nr:helix-turn-helix domain-containing protein [Acidimicrobiaceae bacterium]